MMDELKDSNLMDWGDTLENDGGYRTLPEGDYLFRITDVTRGRFPGSKKLPACNKAEITAVVREEGAEVSVKFDLILYRTLEWKLSAFFRCIGQKQQGKSVTMDWKKVPGAKGKFHLRPRTYQGADGREHTVNEVTGFSDYDPADWDEPDWITEAENAFALEPLTGGY